MSVTTIHARRDLPIGRAALRMIRQIDDVGHRFETFGAFVSAGKSTYLIHAAFGAIVKTRSLSAFAPARSPRCASACPSQAWTSTRPQFGQGLSDGSVSNRIGTRPFQQLFRLFPR